jgi:DNA-binding transcriptional ArsR family regulator
VPPPGTGARGQSNLLLLRYLRRRRHARTRLTGVSGERIVKQVLNQWPGPDPFPELDRMFAALADPSRRGIVERLSRGPASVSELARPLAMSLPAVLQHLQVLEISGLVRSAKQGRVRTCRLDPVALRTAEQWIADRRAGLSASLDRLGAYLAAHPDDEEQT